MNLHLTQFSCNTREAKHRNAAVHVTKVFFQTPKLFVDAPKLCVDILIGTLIEQMEQMNIGLLPSLVLYNSIAQLDVWQFIKI